MLDADILDRTRGLMEAAVGEMGERGEMTALPPGGGKRLRGGKRTLCGFDAARIGAEKIEPRLESVRHHEAWLGCDQRFGRAERVARIDRELAHRVGVASRAVGAGAREKIVVDVLASHVSGPSMVVARMRQEIPPLDRAADLAAVEPHIAEHPVVERGERAAGLAVARPCGEVLEAGKQFRQFERLHSVVSSIVVWPARNCAWPEVDRAGRLRRRARRQSPGKQGSAVRKNARGRWRRAIAAMPAPRAARRLPGISRRMAAQGTSAPRGPRGRPPGIAQNAVVEMRQRRMRGPQCQPAEQCLACALASLL